ncbi:MAG: hypothetical protein IPJ85_16680 [Flavobacteriales bacterium]|nr:hypothetical protein [Flavobacteriales bacterium]
MRLTLVFFCLLAATITCTGQSITGKEAPAVKELTPEQLSAMMKASALIILDCNEKENYEWAHVPGARLIEYDRVTSETLPADMDALLVFYCYSPECPAGSMAAATAARMGYRNVYSMTAGIVGWQDAGLPTEP